MPAVAEEKMDTVEVPTKIVSTKVNLNLRAQIQYLDFEGLSKIYFMSLFW